MRGKLWVVYATACDYIYAATWDYAPIHLLGDCCVVLSEHASVNCALLLMKRWSLRGDWARDCIGACVETGTGPTWLPAWRLLHRVRCEVITILKAVWSYYQRGGCAVYCNLPRKWTLDSVVWRSWPDRGVLGVFSTTWRLILLALKAAFWRSLEPAYNTLYAAHPLKNTMYDEYPLKTELYAILRLRGGKTFFYLCLRWKLVPYHIYAESDDIMLIIYCVPAWILKWTQFFCWNKP